MRAGLVFGFVLALSACTDRSYTPTVPQALEIGTPYTVFAATSREQNADGSFGYGRSQDISLLELTVSIPPSHRPGELKFAYAEPDPQAQFTMAGRSGFASPGAFQARLRRELQGKTGSAREVTIFVHGYNATQAETAFRAAQLAHDMEFPGVMTIYSWPSRGEVLGYAYDSDSMLYARDGLEQLLRQIQGAGVSNIAIVAHSMGAALTMETLRQIDIRDPGWSARNLSGVVLISPDLDVELFRSQMDRLAQIPEPFIVMVSGKDRALGLSGWLRGTTDRDRLGNIRNIDKLADLPISVIDTTAFSDSAGSTHFVAATSPALIAIFKSARDVAKTFGPDRTILNTPLPAAALRPKGAITIQLAPPAGLPG